MKRKLKLLDVEDVKFVPGAVISLPPKTKSWQVWVIADNSGEWASNAMRYATKERAEKGARDLASRWMLVTDWKVEPSTDEVNE